MPLFYFDLCNGARDPDDDGTELSGLEDARIQAVRLMGEMLRFDSRPVLDGEALSVEVLDEARAALFIVKVSASSLFPES